MKAVPAYPMIRVRLKDENSRCLSYDPEQIRLKDENSPFLSYDPDPAEG
jgi:hypothetical protein